MSINRCPHCSILYTDDEVDQGSCPGCNAPLGPTPRPDVPPPAPAPSPRRAAPFLLGLFVGCLVGLAALWVALRLGAPLPGGAAEQPAGPPPVPPRKPESDAQARAAEAGRANAVKAAGAAKQQAAAALKQKDEAEQRLRDALARLAEEQGRRASLETALAELKKPRPAPARSFVRDWQLLGPFPSTGLLAHDTVYPPEGRPLELKKAYAGHGGAIRWQPYHSPEDKIDLAAFFDYREAGAAYAVTRAHSDEDRAVALAVGSDDGVRVWVNGEKAHDVKGGRQARPGQDVVKARLRKGWNEVRAKVDNIVGTWELYLEFRTADGGQPLEVFTTSTPPPAAGR